MQPYLKKALRQFQNLVPPTQHDLPYSHVPLMYRATKQYAAYDDSLPTGSKATMHVLKVNDKFLWYARAVDGMLLTTLSMLVSQQKAPMMQTMKQVKQFLDYCTTQEPTVLTYYKSEMVLASHNNAGYLKNPSA